MNFSVQEFKVVMVYMLPRGYRDITCIMFLFSPYLPKTLPLGNFFFQL